MVLNKLRDGKTPVILAVNKVDNVQEKADLLPHLQWLGSQMNFLDIVPLSAETGLNVDTIAGIVRKHLPEATHHFPEDYITDRSQRFMASEIIREKLMRFLGAELPYSVTVEIERFQSNERGGYDINGLILVEREGQKKMVIGNKGAKIKTIGIEARKDMQEMLQKAHVPNVPTSKAPYSPLRRCWSALAGEGKSKPCAALKPSLWRFPFLASRFTAVCTSMNSFHAFLNMRLASLNFSSIICTVSRPLLAQPVRLNPPCAVSSWRCWVTWDMASIFCIVRGVETRSKTG